MAVQSWMNIHCIFLEAFSDIQISVLSLRKVKGTAGAAEIFESAAFVSWVFHESLLGISSFARSSVSNLTTMQLGWCPSSRSKRGAEFLCRAGSHHYNYLGWKWGIVRLKCGRQENGSLPTKAAVVSRNVRWCRKQVSHQTRKMPGSAYFKPLSGTCSHRFSLVDLAPTKKQSSSYWSLMNSTLPLFCLAKLRALALGR